MIHVVVAEERRQPPQKDECAMSFLSTHFSLEELIASDYATRYGIDNTPSADVLENLGVLASGLERVRSVLGMPVRINSGYRCPKLNSRIGGARDSAHMKGMAADIVCPEFGTPQEIAVALIERKLFIGYDQLILEGDWCHVAFGDTPRYEELTAHFGPGLTTYTRGIA